MMSPPLTTAYSSGKDTALYFKYYATKFTVRRKLVKNAARVGFSEFSRLKPCIGRPNYPRMWTRRAGLL